MEDMKMKIIEYVKQKLNLTNYGVAKELRSLGIDVTTQGIDQYLKGSPRSMRFDVLLGIKKLSKLSWEDFGRLLEKEYGV